MYKFIFLFFLSFSAMAEEFDFTWRDEDTVRATILVLEHAIDANQTKKIKEHQPYCTTTETVAPQENNSNIVSKSFTLPSSQTICHEGLHELNPIIGQNASNAKINAYFITLSALEIVVASLLPQRYRDVFQYVRIIDTGETIYSNYKIGLGMSIGF